MDTVISYLPFWPQSCLRGGWLHSQQTTRRHREITDTKTESHLNNKQHSPQSYTEFQHHRWVSNLTNYFHECNGEKKSLQTRLSKLLTRWCFFNTICLKQYNICIWWYQKNRSYKKRKNRSPIKQHWLMDTGGAVVESMLMILDIYAILPHD